MIIRNAALNTTRRTLPLQPATLNRRVSQASPIDSFESVAPVSKLPVVQAPQARAQALTSSSSGGGFFSRLWSGIKNVAGNLLGQVGTWFSANVGGYISKAQTFASDLVGGLLTKASTWFQGILASWSQKLGN